MVVVYYKGTLVLLLRCAAGAVYGSNGCRAPYEYDSCTKAKPKESNFKRPLEN